MTTSTSSYSMLSRSRSQRAARNGLSRVDLTTLVHEVSEDPSRWQSRVQIPAGVDRWWTRLSADCDVDVWLLSWLPGHTTELHDHGSSAAALAVVRGRLVEIRADSRGRQTSFARRPGQVTWLAPGAIHDVRGSGGEPAVSIHAYSPPLQQMNYYGADETGALHVVRSVHTDEPEEELVR
jgi:mannose-6-phosphate isomerase-like protein (cupin superfamily)